MKKLNRHSIALLCFVALAALLATGCKKAHGDITNDADLLLNTNVDPAKVAERVKGSWQWDSSVIYNHDTGEREFTFTPSVLKTNTVTPAVVTCTTVSNFTLNFSNNPVTGLGSGSGYYDTYTEEDALTQYSQAVLNLTSKYKWYNKTVDTAITQRWLILPYPDKKKLYLHIAGSYLPQHDCAMQAGYQVFLPLYYTIWSVTTAVMELRVIAGQGTSEYAVSSIYFHRLP